MFKKFTVCVAPETYSQKGLEKKNKVVFCLIVLKMLLIMKCTILRITMKEKKTDRHPCSSLTIVMTLPKLDNMQKLITQSSNSCGNARNPK